MVKMGADDPDTYDAVMRNAAEHQARAMRAYGRGRKVGGFLGGFLGWLLLFATPFVFVASLGLVSAVLWRCFSWGWHIL